MSQKGEDFDISFKNAQNSTQTSGSQLQGPSNSTQQLQMPPPGSTASSSAFNPAAAAAPYWDPFWGTPAPFFGYQNSQFDFRDDMNKNPMMNQAYPPAPSSTKGGAAGSSSATNIQSTSRHVQNPMPNPYMDPSMFFYAQQFQATMAAMYAAQYGPFQPYGMGMMPFQPTPRQHLPDDQQSIQSFHFDMDARSEKKHPLLMNANRAQSIAGDPALFKTEPTEPKVRNSSGAGLLLMEDPGAAGNASADVPTGGGLIEPITAAKSRDENRMTPLTHQLPHVRASFSLNAMIKVRANDPCEGQPALVDIINLGDMMEHFLSNLKNMKPNEVEIGNDLINDDYDPNANDISDDTRTEILNNNKLMQEFPGPLVKETTSKAQVIQFCQKNVKECLSNSNVNLIDPQSHALLWDFLALLVRQNGIFDLKTDISPLLLSGMADPSASQPTTQLNPVASSSSKTAIIKQSASSSSLIQQQQDFVLVNNEEPATNSEKPASSSPLPHPQNDEELHLNKLRQLLGAGQRTDAIDLAIKHNMWPHALFLASSFNNSSSISLSASSASIISSAAAAAAAQQQNEPKLLHKVKVRFINSLQPNDPIHTCYQLLIGRVPSIASNVAKAEWNDWRRHLAMIVSNVDDSNRDLVYTTIKAMGDSLASNGRVAASHFCYLLSNCPFGTFNKKSSKLVLIGSSHNQEYSKFCQTSAIQATEVFEFANSLCMTKSSPILEHFVKYKLIYATRLIEYGLVNEAYKYIEVIAKSVNLNPKLHADKISPVFHLANRLRVYDPDFNTSDDGSSLLNEPVWLQELTNNFKKQHLGKLGYLLPEARAGEQPVAPPGPSNIQAASASTAESHYEPVSYQSQPNEVDQMAGLSLNPNPNYNSAGGQYEQHTQYEQQQQHHHHQYVHSQSMSFVPVVHNEPVQMQPEQPQVEHPQYYQPSQAAHLNPDAYQHAQNQYYNPNQASGADSGNQQASQSRKSSVASMFNQPNDYYQAPTTKQRNTSTSGGDTGYAPSRSRESSVSTSAAPPPPTFTPFNPYSNQPAKIEPSHGFFDPNQLQQQAIPKSQTFPVQHQQQHIKDEPSSDEPEPSGNNNKPKKPYYFEDEDDDQFKAPPANKPDESKLSADQQQNKGWLGRALNYIKPASGPKKMILPDDRKKTIVWDDKLKRYVNKDGSSGDGGETVKPPPLVPIATQQQPSTPAPSSDIKPGPPSTDQQNRFSLKSASKQNYYSKLDYFAANDPNKKAGAGAAADPKLLPPVLSNIPPPSQMPPRFFVPEPNAASSSLENNQQAQHSQQPMFIPNNQEYYNPGGQQQQQQQYYQSHYDNQSDETGTGTTSNNDSPPVSNSNVSSSNDSGSSSSYNQHYQGYDPAQYHQQFHSNI